MVTPIQHKILRPRHDRVSKKASKWEIGYDDNRTDRIKWWQMVHFSVGRHIDWLNCMGRRISSWSSWELYLWTCNESESVRWTCVCGLSWIFMRKASHARLCSCTKWQSERRNGEYDNTHYRFRRNNKMCWTISLHDEFKFRRLNHQKLNLIAFGHSTLIH